MCLLQMQRKVSHNWSDAQKESDKETRQLDMSGTSDTLNVHLDVLRKTLEMRAHSEKFMNVSDMQVPDEDDRHQEQSRSKTIKANSKTLKETILDDRSPLRQQTTRS